MWWPIRYQWLVPSAIILLIAVAVTSVSSAWLAAKRNTTTTLEQLNRVIDTLVHSRFPFSQNVLEQMRGLSGAEFAAFDSAGELLASTIPNETIPSHFLAQVEQRGRIESLSEKSVATLNDRRYFASVITPVYSDVRVDALLVLYPEASWQEARADAIVPPLLVGAATLGLLGIVSAWLASRMSRRIQKLKEQVAAIAEGDFLQLPLESRRDELQELSRSVNLMSRQLLQMRETIRRTEQTRLLGQLAGGLAHQLRNAITGARMAVQIHARRCSSPDEESLHVALRQLELTEEQIRGLLSVGKPEKRTPIPREVKPLLDEIRMLVGPVCKHSGVEFELEISLDPNREDGPALVEDSERVRTAVLNLVLNAIDAAGAKGKVWLKGSCQSHQIVFEVIDTGSGPPAELGDHIFDVFVTGKPEGVGFGLALAHQVAVEQQGQLTWARIENTTCFRLVLTVPQRVSHELSS